MDKIDFLVVQRAWRFIPPILLIIGAFGNILSIIVLLRKRFRSSSLSVYLMCLAIVDLGALYSGLLPSWLSYTFDLYLRNYNNFLCKSIGFIHNFTMQLSPWFLVAITMERVMAVWFPLSSRIRRTRCRRTALIATIIIVVCLICVNSYIYVVVGYTEFSDSNVTATKCGDVPKYDYWEAKVWSWIDLALFSGIPFSFLLVGSVLISYKLTKSRREIRKLSENTGRNQQDQNSRNATKLLILLNVTFFVCMVPSSICFIALMHSEYLSYNWGLQYVLFQISRLLAYCNNTFNFVLYCVSGSVFRNELKRVFCKCS